MLNGLERTSCQHGLACRVKLGPGQIYRALGRPGWSGKEIRSPFRWPRLHSTTPRCTPRRGWWRLAIHIHLAALLRPLAAPLLSDAGSSSSTSRNPPARGSPKILPNSPTPPRRRVRSHGPLQEVGRQLPRWVLLLVRCSRMPQSFTSCWFLSVISVSVIRRSPHRPSLVEMR
jgi:hypothetical protein